MKLQSTFIYIAGVFFAVGFAASQAVAGTGPEFCAAGPGATMPMEIEINALRAGGKTIVTTRNNTTKVTAKARILKGTAPSGTTMDSTLTIQSLDGNQEVIGTNATAINAVTLGVGKGGKGATLVLDTSRCVGGYIFFTATFFGTSFNNQPCDGTRTIRKECQ